MSSDAEVNTEEDDETAAEDREGEEEEQTEFNEEYEKLKSQTCEVLGCLDQLRQDLDDRVVQVRARTLQELVENAEDVEAMKSEMERVRRMLRATEKCLVENFSSSLEALRQSLATYWEVTHGKLNDDRKELTASGTVVEWGLRITDIRLTDNRPPGAVVRGGRMSGHRGLGTAIITGPEDGYHRCHPHA